MKTIMDNPKYSGYTSAFDDDPQRNVSDAGGSIYLDTHWSATLALVNVNSGQVLIQFSYGFDINHDAVTPHPLTQLGPHY